jgi:hypothetical protein
MSSESELIECLAQKIGDYLGQNPEAADGIEGIMQWWLTDNQPGKTRLRVRAALDRLEKAQLVSRTVLQDGTEVFARRGAG